MAGSSGGRAGSSHSYMQGLEQCRLFIITYFILYDIHDNGTSYIHSVHVQVCLYGQTASSVHQYLQAHKDSYVYIHSLLTC